VATRKTSSNGWASPPENVPSVPKPPEDIRRRRMTMRSRIESKIVAVFVLGVSLLFLLGLSPARSDEEHGRLYATVWPFPGSALATIDLQTKTLNVIGNTEFTDSAALAICPAEGEYRHKAEAYTITNIFEEPSPSHLAVLDLHTAAEKQVGSPLPPGQDMMALECSRNGILYAVGGSDPTNQLSEYNTLYLINRGTGQLTRIGFTGVNDLTGNDMFMALRFAPSGKLYGANVYSLYRINRLTGHADKVVDFSNNVKGNVMGLAIDGDGNFYIAVYSSDPTVPPVYSLNAHTGEATPIVNSGYTFVHSIAFKTPGRE
jgi:hypothetical protein